MTQPTQYVRNFGFANFEATHPTDTKPGAELDSEFDTAAISINALIANLALIQRDDGLLANLSVHPQAIKAETLTLFNSSLNPRGSWLTATAYAVNDIVLQGTKTYVCLTAHTSGTFATDLAAEKWLVIVDNTSTVSFAAKGSWLTATAYVLGDVVTQSGGTYICAIAHTSGTFATDLAASRWILLISNTVSVTFAAKGAWVTATAYAIGDIVVQANSVYLCAVAHTSGTFATDLAAAKWVLIATNPVFTARGGWLTATAYNFGDIVTESSNYYICAVSHTSGTFATDLTAAKWVLVSPAPTTPPSQTGRLIRQVIVSAAGVTNITRTAGASGFVLTMVGAGGGGGGSAQGASTGGCGGGGGSGGGVYGYIPYSAIGAGDLTFTLGALGAGGAAGNNAGSAGATSTLVVNSVTLVSLTGGAGGASVAAGSALTAISGGAAGTVTVDASVTAYLRQIVGQQGDNGIRRTADSLESGYGGTPPLGHGHGGRRRIATSAASSGVGNPGSGAGAGGSGAVSTSSSTNQAGGAGTAAMYIFEEYT